MLKTLAMLFMLGCASFACAGDPSQPGVWLIRTPDQGVYPRAAVDGSGTLHLIYFKGDARGGDVFYVRSDHPREGFSKPVHVNSLPDSAMIIGTVRGPQLALGRDQRVHVAWMGTQSEMWYTRMDDSRQAFESQRNIATRRPGLDGGGTVAADSSGNVFIVWHAPASAKEHDEAARRVWIARSSDEGKTFAAETDGGAPPRGVCACCNLAAWAQRENLYVLYRCATKKVHRDIHLLSFNDQLQCTADRTVAETQINKCVMSTASFAAGVGAFESNGQVHWIRLATEDAPITPPGDAQRKHPSIAISPTGHVLLTWTEGSSWNHGGRLAWQRFDSTGKPGETSGGGELPAFSVPAAVARPEGFFIIY
jgi:hypothetical protein